VDPGPGCAKDLQIAYACGCSFAASITFASTDAETNLETWHVETQGHPYLRLYIRGWGNEQAKVCVGATCVGPAPSGIGEAASVAGGHQSNECGGNAWYAVDFDVAGKFFVTVLADDPKSGGFGQLFVGDLLLHDGLPKACNPG
jgi:hypothetical protein